MSYAGTYGEHDNCVHITAYHSAINTVIDDRDTARAELADLADRLSDATHLAQMGRVFHGELQAARAELAALRARIEALAQQWDAVPLGVDFAADVRALAAEVSP